MHLVRLRFAAGRTGGSSGRAATGRSLEATRRCSSSPARILTMLRPIGLLLALSGTLSAQVPPATPGTAPNAPAQGAPQQRPGPRPFAEVTKGAEFRPGFFDTYEKDDKVWIAVPRERLGKDFLMEMKLAQGIGANGLFGGSMLNLFEANIMTLERRGDQIFLLQKPSRFTGGRDGAVNRAVDLTFGPSVIDGARSQSFRPHSAA